MTLVAGKRCGPGLLFLALAVVLVSLLFFSLHRSRALAPQPAPMHESR